MITEIILVGIVVAYILAAISFLVIFSLDPELKERHFGTMVLSSIFWPITLYLYYTDG